MSTNVLLMFMLGALVVAILHEYVVSISLWGDQSSDALRFIPEQLATSSLTKKQKQQQRSKYPKNDGNTIGVLSTKDPSFFQSMQDEIDAQDAQERCQRYNFAYDINAPPRRIFWGALVASEPWELFEIVATEAYDIYAGIVLVESNRTQNFSPRNVTRLHHTSTMEDLFFDQQLPNRESPPVKRVDIRLFVDENPNVKPMDREHAQRQEIFRGWKEMGMQRDDIAIMSDSDEVMTRDFLRALQMCVVNELDYKKHGCQPNKMGIRAAAQIFQSSPECITVNRIGPQPNAFVGHCLEEIGDSQLHPLAPRDGYYRSPGWHIKDWNASADQVPPLINSADFRRMGGHKRVFLASSSKHFQSYTGFHFHNFFATASDIRFKYGTYGHAVGKVHTKRIDEIGDELAMVARCARGDPDPLDAKEQCEEGGFDALSPFLPIYFHDKDYRKRRHEMIQEMVFQDDLHWKEQQAK